MDILNAFDNNVKFTKRSTPIPLGARMSYRIAQICLILRVCCNPRESCSMQKLQTISNALFQQNEFESLVLYVKNPSYVLEFTPRIDPCVNTAVEFALKYGLCKEINNGRKYKLTTLGLKFADSILKEDIMVKEKTLLNKLGTDFTEQLIDNLLG